MTPISQIIALENIVAKAVKACLKTKTFAGVMLTTGWGGSEKLDDGTVIPLLRSAPYLEIVANESIALDDEPTREVTVRATLETCQDEGYSAHECREKKLAETLCKLTADNTGSVGRWRWTVIRGYSEDGGFNTEFSAVVTVDDPCYDC